MTLIVSAVDLVEASSVGVWPSSPVAAEPGCEAAPPGSGRPRARHLHCWGVWQPVPDADVEEELFERACVCGADQLVAGDCLSVRVVRRALQSRSFSSARPAGLHAVQGLARPAASGGVR